MRHLNRCLHPIHQPHRRVGHLFQGRFKGILVQKETYLLELARHIVLNPVRTGLVADPKDWVWSSCRGTVGLERRPEFLTSDWLLAAFGDERQGAISAFVRFVAEGKERESLYKDLKGQIYQGSAHFVEEMQKRIRPDQPLREIPLCQRR